MSTATRLWLRRLVPIARQDLIHRSSFSTSKKRALPKAPLNLDPSLETLLKDVDISLKNAKKHPIDIHRELEVVSADSEAIGFQLPNDEWSPMEEMNDLEDVVEREHRKSPAALFGSSQIGSVIIPFELQSAINLLISDAQKSLLHSDARRLFQSPESSDGKEGEWDTLYDTQYRTRRQTAQHGVRDGTAFASVALPAHYSSISSVINHAKLRLASSLEVDRIIDWGAGTGSGFWASIYSFQDGISSEDDVHDVAAAKSKIRSYIGIDKREGLVTIAKRLIAHTPTGGLSVRWQKSYRDDNKLMQHERPKTIALSAFMLTTLPSPLAQKEMVKEMWDSGAQTIVLIDHDSEEGFKAVAHAREYLLDLGRLEADDPEHASELRGSHVLAPCSHDTLCPLLHSGGPQLVCGFSQRLQRPSFVQRTKHSGVGHEDIHYSYVIIRRGPRPARVDTNVGRVGGIGRRVLEKEQSIMPMRELEVHNEAEAAAENHSPVELSLQSQTEDDGMTESELQAQLRKEAYNWPRLVFPPLKKSGHIILDACTAEGKIMRLTIPKSQGKQAYYDARKSSWGDLFPHPPKNQPLERYQPKNQRKGESPSTGDDIGKRRDQHKRRERASYNDLGESLKEKKKLSRREYAKIRGDKVWEDVA